NRTLEQDILTLNDQMKPKLLEIGKICKALQVEIIQDMEAVEALGKQLAEEGQLVQQIRKAMELRNLLDDLKQSTKKWETRSQLKIDKETKRKKLYDGEAIDIQVQSLITKWTANIQDISHVIQAITSLKTKIDEISKERDTFLTQL